MQISLQNDWDTLRMLYRHPADIDLFTGALLEKPAEWGIVGNTLKFMLRDQFERLLQGDRFFYTHVGQVGSFTKEQRELINARTFSDILCDNTAILELQENVFKVPDAKVS